MARIKLNYSKKEIEDNLKKGIMYCGMFKIKTKGFPFPEIVHIYRFNDCIELRDRYNFFYTMNKDCSYKELRKAAKRLLEDVANI